MDEFANSSRSLSGFPFTKMTGSGNDFVFFDAREVPTALVTTPEMISAICNRHTGIGADGVVVLEAAPGEGDARILYFNSDGSAADLCGNATLCSSQLAVELGLATADGMILLTPAGRIRSRVDGPAPEIDLPPVTDVRQTIDIALEPGEHRIGFTTVGIPHLVVLCDSADAVNVAGRGPILRHHPAVGATGANVNWVSARPDGNWRYRTFERGVEGETLACGTGAIASAILLSHWSLASAPVVIRTSSGRDLEVRFRPDELGEGIWLPTLKGEGRIVFRGQIATLEG